MSKPMVKDCLDEIRRLRAENARLTRLVAVHRPELEDLRKLETGIRDCVDNWPDALLDLLRLARSMTKTQDDLPSFEEMSGFWSEARDRVYAALGESQSADAVDPHAASTGKPSTREK